MPLEIPKVDFELNVNFVPDRHVSRTDRFDRIFDCC